MCTYVCVCADSHSRGLSHEEVSDPLELEARAVASCHTQVLGTELRFSEEQFALLTAGMSLTPASSLLALVVIIHFLQVVTKTDNQSS